MLRLVRKARMNSKGFTLVELMVVVVIIGILVAIAVPVYNTVTTNAEENACLANQRMVNGAYQMYRANGGAQINDLVGLSALEPAWILEIPDCPGTGGYSFTHAGGLVCSVHQ